MLTNSFICKVIFLSVAVVMLTQCAKHLDSPQQARAKTPFNLTTDTYLALANKQVGHDKQRLLLQAAGRSLADGQWQKAADILAQTEHLSSIQQDEKHIFLAQIDAKRHRLANAITTLSAIHQVDRLSPYFQLIYHELLAQAYQTTGL